MTTRIVSGPNSYVSYQNNETIAFLGTGNRLITDYCSNLWVVAEGKNQTLFMSANAPEKGDAVVDLGKGLTLEVGGIFGALTVYDFQKDAGAKLTLQSSQHDAVASDGHGGTMVSVFGRGPVLCGKIDFVGDTHVAVVHP